jgi:hypothetical protein
VEDFGIGELKMLAIYEKSTGKVKRISLCENREPSWEEVASDLDPETHGSFTEENDQGKILQQHRYLVRFDAENNPYLEFQPRKLIQLSCDCPLLPDGRYQLPADGVSTTNLTIAFKDENDIALFPVGMLEISPTRGSVSQRFITLDGSQSSVSVTFTSVAETVSVQISAKIAELPEFEKGLARIELVPPSP